MRGFSVLGATLSDAAPRSLQSTVLWGNRPVRGTPTYSQSFVCEFVKRRVVFHALQLFFFTHSSENPAQASFKNQIFDNKYCFEGIIIMSVGFVLLYSCTSIPLTRVYLLPFTEEHELTQRFSNLAPLKWIKIMLLTVLRCLVFPSHFDIRPFFGCSFFFFFCLFFF